MKFPLSWLRDYIKIDCSSEELVDKLTMAGLEVEQVATIGESLSGIITGRIDCITKHPDADKLVITSVFDGKTHHQIVTGASNITEGDIVPVSLPGAVLANGTKIKSTKLRGVQSDGMLCSEAECGVTEHSAGIWILSKDTPIGIDFIDYAILHDVILDISILPNRGDCQSILGLAREIAALTGQPFSLPPVTLSETAIDHNYSVETYSELCPLYLGRYITSITNTSAPLWMQRRLQLCGIRPISMIVDITNYVLLETGHPLHAFDDQKCDQKSFSISEAAEATTITTLDGQKRSLSSQQLLILNDDNPVAIAGIMGGQNTEVSESTHSIFLEAAYFDPTSIRRAATSLGLRTESSMRFEKGVCVDTVDYASQRAASLLVTYAGASVSNNVTTASLPNHPCFDTHTLTLSPDQLNTFLGSKFTSQQIETVLTSLGFKVDNTLVTIPSWRAHDIKEWPCIAEEVARLIGFDTIESTLPHSLPIQDNDDPLVELTKITQDFFVANGFNEVNTYPMIAEDDLNYISQLKKDDWNELANPISPQLAIMRPLLLPSLLSLVSYHSTRQLPNQVLFEVGRSFQKDLEISSLGVVISGKHDLGAYTAANRALELDIFSTLTHTCKRFFKQLGLDISLSHDSKSVATWSHPHLNYTISLNKTFIGSLAQVHPTVLDHYGIKDPVVYLDVNLTKLLTLQNSNSIYRPFSRFPSTRRDIALCVPDTLTFADIMDVVTKFKHKTVIKTGIFDVFESESLAPYSRSIGIYFIYQSMTETLSDEIVNKNHQRLCDRLTESLPVQIR